MNLEVSPAKTLKKSPSAKGGIFRQGEGLRKDKEQELSAWGSWKEKDIFWEFQELINPSLVTLAVSALVGCKAEMPVQGCLAPAAPTDPPFPVTAGNTDSQKDFSFPTAPQGKLKKGKVKAISVCSHSGSPNSIHLGYSQKMLSNKLERQS